MDEVDRFLEDEDEIYSDEQPEALAIPEDIDGALTSEPVDESSWTRPELPDLQPAKDTVGVSLKSPPLHEPDRPAIICTGSTDHVE
jgi:hypothetical protein